MMDEQQGRQLTFHDLLEIASRRRWLILGCVVVIGVAGIFLAMAKPDVYTAKTVFLVKDPTSVSQLLGPALVGVPFQRRIATIREDVRAFANVRLVVEDLDLAKGGKSVDQVAREILSEIELEVLTATAGDTTVVLSYTDVSPSAAANVANQIREQYVSSLVNGYLETVKRVYDQDKERLETIQEEQRERFDAMRELESEFFFELATAKPQTQLERERIDAELRRVDAKISSKEELLEKGAERLAGLNEVSEKTVEQENPRWAKAKKRVDDLRDEVNDLSDLYTEKHVPLQVARADLEKAEAALAEEDRLLVRRTVIGQNEDYLEAQRKISETRDQLKKLKQERAGLLVDRTENNRRAGELPHVMRRQSELQSAIDTGAARLAEASSAFARSNRNWDGARKTAQFYFETVDQARVPRTPSGPNRPLWMAGGIALGLLVGLGLSVVLYLLSRSIASVTEAKTLLDIPVMGTVQTIRSNLEIERGRRRRSMAVVFTILVVFSGVAFGLVYTQFPELLPGFVRDSITAFREQIR